MALYPRALQISRASIMGLLPICASCKKIRNDSGYWSELESYILERTDASFTHGLYPICTKKLYPDLLDSVESEDKAVQDSEADSDKSSKGR